MIKWDNAYSTGIERIDEQHQRLFQYINDLENAVHQGDVSTALIVNALNFFEAYAKEHFKDEEGCMHQYKCPVAHTNHTAHQMFMESYKYYRDLLAKEGATPQLIDALLKWAQDWLVSHICKIDTQLKPCVHKEKSS